MRAFWWMGTCTLSLLATACGAASPQVSPRYAVEAGERFTPAIVRQDTVPDEAVARLEARLDAQLARADLLAAERERGGKTLEVVITDYPDAPASRDDLRSTVLIKDAERVVVGRYDVRTRGHGDGEALIDEHADDVVETLRGGR